MLLCQKKCPTSALTVIREEKITEDIEEDKTEDVEDVKTEEMDEAEEKKEGYQ